VLRCPVGAWSSVIQNCHPTGADGHEGSGCQSAEGVQSLLLEGGPTIATAFLEAGYVDKLLLFVAPVVAGEGPRFLGDLQEPLEMLHLRSEPSGEDVLVEAYIREP